MAVEPPFAAIRISSVKTREFEVTVDGSEVTLVASMVLGDSASSAFSDPRAAHKSD